MLRACSGSSFLFIRIFHNTEELQLLNAGKGRPWDLFSSHRAADVDGINSKKTFVSILHDHLRQAGVEAFVDGKSLKPGSPAWEVMQDAVQCAVALPVLTAGCGNSEWYLQELATMMDALGLTVMLLFLDKNGTENQQGDCGGS